MGKVGAGVAFSGGVFFGDGMEQLVVAAEYRARADLIPQCFNFS